MRYPPLERPNEPSLAWDIINNVREFYIRGAIDEDGVRVALDPSNTGRAALEDLIRVWGYERTRHRVKRLTRLS